MEVGAVPELLGVGAIPELLGVARERNTTSAMAILSYAGNDVRPRMEQSRSLAVAHPDHVMPVPPAPDRALLLLNTQNRIGGHLRWAINGVSLKFPATPYLVSMKRGLRGAYDDARPPPETYDYRSYDIERPPPANRTVASAVYRLALGSLVDVVLQNTVALNNRSETHPWHLHGHDFWVLAYGDGKFDPERDTAKFNLRDPVMKNTVALHPLGWTAVRFVADNPGVWLFHCHIEAHVYMGMGVVFEEGVDRVGPVSPRVEQSWSIAVAHPDVAPVPPRPRRGPLVLNTQTQNRTDDGTIINLGSPAMDPQAPPPVNNAPGVSIENEANAESKRISKMLIPVCSLTVAAALALILGIMFQKPSDAGDDAAAAALYSVALTFIILGMGVSVVLVIYSIVAKRSRSPGITRVLKAAMLMSLTFVLGLFIVCAVFMLALPWLFFVGAVAAAMALYLAFTWKKDDGAEGSGTQSGVDGADRV